MLQRVRVFQLTKGSLTSAICCFSMIIFLVHCVIISFLADSLATNSFSFFLFFWLHTSSTTHTAMTIPKKTANAANWYVCSGKALTFNGSSSSAWYGKTKWTRIIIQFLLDGLRNCLAKLDSSTRLIDNRISECWVLEKLFILIF